MPLDWDALLTDEKVIAMSDQAFRAYMHLLRAAWQSDNPASLPDNDSFLARVSGLGLEAWTQVKPELQDCFRVSNGRWHQKRMRKVYDAVISRQKSWSDRGKAGAAKRWNDKPHDGSAMAQPSPTQSLDDGSKSKSESKRSEPPIQRPPDAEVTPKPPRPRDAAFDALARMTGVDPLQLTKSGAASIGTALSEIRKVFPNVSPDEIGRRVEAYRKLFPRASCTAFAIAKHWAACVPGAEPYPHTKHAADDYTRI